jgi:uncharacterized membrane protein YgdD (TMEM256/DUF423 family)
MTAVRYNQVHAVTIVVIGLFLQFNYNCINASQLKWSAIFFIIGTTLFSFSIYLSVWLKIASILIMTPFGGIIIIVGWLTLGAAGIKTLQLFNNKLRP